MKRTITIAKKHIRKLIIAAAIPALILSALAGCKDFSFFNELGVKGGLTITPASVSILTGGTMSFNAYGGNGDYVFSIVSGYHGTIDPASGVYTAPSTACSDVVMVTDSTNLSATATIIVVTTLDALEINPKVATLSPGSSITFVATGGNDSSYEYGFNANNSGGTINSSTGVYTAGAITGASDTIVVTDADLTVCAIPANVSVVAATSSVNYSVTADTFPATVDAGAALSGTFTVTNVGTGNGNKPVAWWLYLSDDGVFGGDGEVLVASNNTGQLNAGDSAVVTPTGSWPVIGGTYTLFVMVTAEDDMTHTDNIYEKTDWEITLTVPDVDYRVTSVTNTSENHVGESISGIVSVDNAGTDDGVTSFTLNLYVSTNNTVDVGDTLVYSTTDTGLPGDDPSPTAPSDYSYSGTWPASPDSYYLVAEVISADDTAAGNDGDNTTAVGPYTVHYRDVDYLVPSVSHLSGTDAGAGVTGEFELDNGGTDDGLADITWKVYASTNTTVDVGDELIASDVITGGMNWDDPIQTVGFSGTWPFEPDQYYLVVEVSAADDTQAGKDGNNEKATSLPIDVTAADVDYYADAISAVAGDAGGPMSVSFDLNNGGMDASSETITWNLYVSTNTYLDAGDYLAASDTEGPLGAAPDSVPVNPAGATWPSTAGSYYLIVEIESLEDIAAGNDGNDVAVSGSTFSVTFPDVDYYADTISASAGNAGGPLSCSFNVHNGGSDPGTLTVTWNLYVSANTTLDAGDYLADYGTAGPLGATPDSVLITPSGATWPSTPGDYYLIVEIESSEDEDAAKTGNDVAVSGSTFNAAAPDVNYTVDQVNFVPAGSTYVPDGPVKGNFVYKNNGSSNGTQPVSWEAYASLDKNLDAGDVLIESGSGLSPLAGTGATSGAIPFSGSWPLDYGKYFILVSVMSSEEVDPADNTGATGTTESVGYFDESLHESNNDYAGLTDAYDLGVTFQPGMSIELTGTMSATDMDDVMAFNTGSCTMITFAVTYVSAKAQIEIFVLDGPNSFIDGVTGTPGSISLNWTVDAAGVKRWLNLDNYGDNPPYNGTYTCVITGN